MASPSISAARIVFAALGVFMFATLVYTIITDGSPFRRELLTPWMIATLIDFYINVIAISVWVFYREASIFSAIIWIIFLICFGSITTCTYIVLQLSRSSFRDTGEDPGYHFLHLTEKQIRNANQEHSSVLLWRAIFSVLGCVMLGTLIYTLVTDGSPFRRELLYPWMIATLIDFYINVIAISFWVVHKEQNWINDLLWIALLVFFGSVSTCAYIVKKLCEVSIEDSVQLVLFTSRNKQVRSSTSG